MTASRRLSTRARLALLVVLGAGIAGPSQCADTSGGALPGAPKAVFSLELLGQGYYAPVGHWSIVEIRVWAGAPYQAFDVDVVWSSSAAVTQAVFGPRSCFDDDGTLFRQPVVDLATGRASGMADLRHQAAAAAAKTCPVAYAAVVTGEPASVSLSVVGEVAAADGTLLAAQPATLAIAPAP